MLQVFVIDRRSGDLPPVEAWHAFREQFRAFRQGETSHFYPLGSALDLALKRLMLRAHSVGLTANDVHQGTFAVLTVGTLVVAAHLIARLRSAASAARFAIPVAVGYVASAQITTATSLYDPLVVHPVFGVLVTFAGLVYLLLVSGLLRNGKSRRTAVMAAAVGIGGVCLYEGFYAYVAVGASMVGWIAWRTPRGERLRAAAPGALWAVAPAATLIIVVRLVAATVSTSTYRGTELRLGGSSVVAWITSMQTTAPGGTWGLTRRAVHAAGVGMSAPSVVTAAVLVAALAGWTVSTRRRRSASAGVAETDDVVTGTVGPVSTNQPPWPLVVGGVLAACMAIFAVSAQWADYLATPGATYMSATSAFWAWAMAVGIGLHLVVTRAASTATVVLTLTAVVLLCGAQIGINDAAVRTELRDPSPFGVDLIRVLDDGTDATLEQRCELLARVPQADQLPGWRDNLNFHYRARHGTAFCA